MLRQETIFWLTLSAAKTEVNLILKLSLVCHLHGNIISLRKGPNITDCVCIKMTINSGLTQTPALLFENVLSRPLSLRYGEISSDKTDDLKPAEDTKSALLEMFCPRSL